MIRDLGTVLFRVLTVFLLPLFVIGYALYGARVWLWNQANRNPLEGVWEFTIIKEDD
jgi:hypothetical protein